MADVQAGELSEERLARLIRLGDLTDDLSLEEAERAIRAGRGLAKLGRIAERMRAAGALPTAGELRREEQEDEELEPDLEAVRTRLASELTAVVALAPLDDELDPHAISSLADAYVRLGGDLMVRPPIPAPRLNRADVDAVERASAAAWTAASQPDAKPDTIAEAVRETLLGLAR